MHFRALFAAVTVIVSLGCGSSVLVGSDEAGGGRGGEGSDVQVGGGGGGGTLGPSCPEVLAPVEGPASEQVIDVDAHWQNACLTRADGQVACWGRGNSFYGAEGGSEPEALLHAPGTLATSLQVEHYCVLSATGEVSCAGFNHVGQLGSGLDVGLGTEALVLVTELPPIEHLVAQHHHNCGVTFAGDLYCWGGNTGPGSLGMSKEVAGGASPTPLRVLENTTALAGNMSHTCAISDGTVYCWGGDGVYGRTPEPLDGLPLDAVDIAVGWSHACATLSDGTLWCWGKVAPQHDWALPREIRGLADVSSVAAGNRRTCAVAGPCRQVTCFPFDSDRGFAPDLGADDVGGVGRLAGAVQVVGHENAFCARLEGGQVACWGRNLAVPTDAPQVDVAAPVFVVE